MKSQLIILLLIVILVVCWMCRETLEGYRGRRREGGISTTTTFVIITGIVFALVGGGYFINWYIKRIEDSGDKKVEVKKKPAQPRVYEQGDGIFSSCVHLEWNDHLCEKYTQVQGHRLFDITGLSEQLLYKEVRNKLKEAAVDAQIDNPRSVWSEIKQEILRVGDTTKWIEHIKKKPHSSTFELQTYNDFGFEHLYIGNVMISAKDTKSNECQVLIQVIAGRLDKNTREEGIEKKWNILTAIDRHMSQISSIWAE